jgi:DNA repair protein RecO (recombination protein O)
MDWRDEGILIASRRHGESSAIVEIFTAAHGRHAGVVRGGGGRRLAPVLQPGALLAVEWSARLAEHLGTFRVDPIRLHAAAIMADRAALAALGAITALVAATLPERDPHPDLYARSLDLVEALAGAPDWPARYAAWELALLAELGSASISPAAR